MCEWHKLTDLPQACGYSEAKRICDLALDIYDLQIYIALASIPFDISDVGIHQVLHGRAYSRYEGLYNGIQYNEKVKSNSPNQSYNNVIHIFVFDLQTHPPPILFNSISYA